MKKLLLGLLTSALLVTGCTSVTKTGALGIDRQQLMLVSVNAAYTSQGDSRFNCALMGTRIGDSFIGFDEVVLDADINAAINILARLYDSEINLYTSAEKVKEILTKRANAVLSASVETAQLGLQDVAPINLELHPKSGLSGNFNKDLTRFS